MAKTIFIASAEPGSGKSIITIGLVNMLLCKTQKIARRRFKACGEYRSRTGYLLHAMQAL